MVRKIVSKLYLAVGRFYLKYFNRSTRVRDFLMWPIASRIVGTTYTLPISLKNGIQMRTDLSDLLGRVILFYGPNTDYIWEPHTIRLMERLIKDSQCSVIAGAHLGYTALMARKAMPSSSVVHTFEPIPYLYDIAAFNATLNQSRLGNVVVHREALSDKKGSTTMVIDSIRSKVASESVDKDHIVSVQTLTLDDLVTSGVMKNPDFALFDVEGHELAVFAGMKHILETHPPKHIIFEVSPRVAGSDVNLQPYIAALSPYGYTFYYIPDDYKCAKIGRMNDVLSLKSLDVRFKSDVRYYNVLASRASVSEFTSLSIRVVS